MCVQTTLSHRTRQNRKTIKVLSALVAVYSVCIIPHYIILTMTIFDRDNTEALPFIYQSHEFTRLLMTANSCLNPLMYSVVSKEFRDKLRYILCKGRAIAGVHAGLNVPSPGVRLEAMTPLPLVARVNRS